MHAALAGSHPVPTRAWHPLARAADRVNADRQQRQAKPEAEASQEVVDLIAVVAKASAAMPMTIFACGLFRDIIVVSSP
jgi:hypothetical protein